MKSTFLTEENITEIQGKQIYCWGLMRSRLIQMLEAFSVEEQVVAVLDNSPKNHGKTVILNREIDVASPDILRSIDNKNAVIVITCDYTEEILNQIEQEGYLEGKVCPVYKYATARDKMELEYRTRYANTPLEDVIIFRSGPIRSAYVQGTDFADNARALFEYMVANGYNEKYKLVWLVKHPEDFAEYAKVPNVEFLSFDWEDSEDATERDRYYHNLCLAKFIFMTDAYGFVQNARKDQIRIQLWHGCGFKTRVNFVRCENRYEYTTVVSDLYADIHADIYGLRNDQVLVTGYAKQDWLRQPYKEGLPKLLNKPEASKYIFWLPTFRVAENQLSNLNQYEINPETGLPIVARKSQMEELNRLLQEMDNLLVIKLHPFQKDLLVSDCDYSNIVLLRNADMVEKDWIINRLMASADAMISDYSSAAVDYLSLDRPLAFTLDDVEEYENSRGFVFDNIREWLPGKEVFTFEDFCEFIKEIGEGRDTTKEKRRKASDKMLKYKDNQNCKRILDAFGIVK